MTTFPPIAEYGLLSNCEQSCLVAPNGRSSGCACPAPTPRACSRRCWTGPPVPTRLGPSDAQVPQHRRYVPGTMVLETTWQTPTGWMTVQDFLAVGPVEDAARRPDYRRPRPIPAPSAP